MSDTDLLTDAVRRMRAGECVEPVAPGERQRTALISQLLPMLTPPLFTWQSGGAEWMSESKDGGLSFAR